MQKNSIAPSYKLCRLIPQWAFQETTLTWTTGSELGGPVLALRGVGQHGIDIPAPTAEEAFNALVDAGNAPEVSMRGGGEWVVYCCQTAGEGNSLAEAALIAWLRLHNLADPDVIDPH